MIRTVSRFGAAIGLGIGLFASGAGAQVTTQSAGEVVPAKCVATVSSDSVTAGAASIVLRAALSADLGDSVSATFPEDSKISVVKVAPSANNQPKEIEVTVNATEAKPGSYPISLKGKAAECTGTVTIGAGK